ncbi:MAG: dihydrodipicolinate synthase family protein [Dehalococcoidia bacterium]
MDFRSIYPAIITPFTSDGDIDEEALISYCTWLSEVPGVGGLVANGHAGEGSSMTEAERLGVLRLLKRELPDVPLVAGVTGDGSRVVAREADLCAEAGADALLVFPAHSWLRFGFQDGAPRERYEAVAQASGLPLILFQFPNATKAAYELDTILSICELDQVVALKEGGRDMIKWDTQVPVIRERFPDLAILTCQDEFLLHTMWESDGALVGYAALIPELMVELLESAKAHDYGAAKSIYDRMAPLTSAVYHRASHIESTAAMKIGLVERGLIPNDTVRTPLMPLGGEVREEIRMALEAAGVSL